jgi:hypothetical protein
VRSQRKEPDVKKLFIFAGMTLGGWAGWGLTERYGVMTAFLMSTVGSLVGVIVAWKAGREWMP